MTDVVMPQMGESIVEGTLTKWLKKPGEHVERDEPLFEISTDKVDTEIPSPSAGVLAEILVQEGTTVGINAVVGRIEDGRHGAAPPAAGCPGPSSRAGTSSALPLPPPEAPAVVDAAPASSSAPAGEPSRRPALAAGAQDGARKQYRPREGQGHRHRRTRNQARPGSLSGQQGRSGSGPRTSAAAARSRAAASTRPHRNKRRDGAGSGQRSAASARARASNPASPRPCPARPLPTASNR